MRYRIFAILGFTILGLSAVVQAQRKPLSNLITANSVGPVKIGMTVAQVRAAVAPMKVSRASDGEGVALIQVKRGTETVMTLYAGEGDPKTKVASDAIIQQIEVWGRNYKTEKGLVPGMALSRAEALYGKVSKITLSEIESREYAQFSSQPSGMDFRIINDVGSAGLYPPASNVTSRYRKGSKVFSVVVHDRPASIVDDETTGTEFTSAYTDLNSGCRSAGGNEGGHVSHFCKGPGSYIIHYFDAATIFQIDVATKDRQWEVPVMNFGLEELSKMPPIEWRLADGKPFAVIATDPKSGKVAVRGLIGFERLNREENGKGAAERVRSMIDSEYSDIVLPATRIERPTGGTRVIAKGHISEYDERCKFVVMAKKGERLSVEINADGWQGEEGPIMVGIVTAPDGSSDGAPGGLVFDSVLEQTGDYEIIVSQNGAKSRAAQIDFTIKVDLVPIKN